MGLEDELKAKTLALISQQMANWVAEIQRSIADHQANLVRSLDELQENVARYDERINEDEIANSMAEVVAANPPAPVATAGPGYEALKGSIASIEKGTSLSEVLTYLVNEVAQYVDRAAMFIVKGPSAIGWYARGFHAPEAIKTVSVPLNADTVFRNVHNSRRSLRGHISHSPSTAQALAKLGGDSQGILAVPLILREKLAAILFADSYQEEIPSDTADLVDVLVLFAGKTIDLPSAPRPATGATTGGTTTDRAAAIRAGGEDVRERAGVPRASAPPPQPAPANDGEGASTVMFNASSFAAMKQQVTPRPGAAAPRAAPAAPPARALSPEDQKAHEEAKRFARLVVSEIKLYNETKVNEGRRNKDIYERLKEDIERGRQMYTDRVPGNVRESTNYFFEELVRILAGGDASALGPM